MDTVTLLEALLAVILATLILAAFLGDVRAASGSRCALQGRSGRRESGHHEDVSTPDAPAPALEHPVDTLEKLGLLRYQGILTEEEFAEKKRSLLERI